MAVVFERPKSLCDVRLHYCAGCTHGIIHRLVAECIEKGVTLETLPLDCYKKMTDLFTEDVYEAISLETCVRERKSEGGPAPEAVAYQLEVAKAQLGL